MHHANFQLADPENIAVCKAMVELGPIARKLCSFVEDLAEDNLDIAYVFTDGGFPAEPLLQVGRCGEVISMCVGLENPLNGQAPPLNKRDHRVGIQGGRTPGCGVEIENRVDDCAGQAHRVDDDMARREGFMIEEGPDFGIHRASILFVGCLQAAPGSDAPGVQRAR
jgi:hypothetical protein